MVRKLIRITIQFIMYVMVVFYVRIVKFSIAFVLYFFYSSIATNVPMNTGFVIGLSRQCTAETLFLQSESSSCAAVTLTIA